MCTCRPTCIQFDRPVYSAEHPVLRFVLRLAGTLNLSSVQSLDRLGRRGEWRGDSAEILFHSFLQRPMWVSVEWARMSPLWFCPSSISCANHGVARPPKCPEGWFGRGRRGLWHARTIHVSVSWQLPEEVRVDTQGSWSCSAPSRWSCVSSSSKQGPYLTTIEEVSHKRHTGHHTDMETSHGSLVFMFLLIMV